MKTVETINELKTDLENRDRYIVVQGDAAKAIRAKATRRKTARWIVIGGVLLSIAGLAAVKYTGGKSTIATAGGAVVSTVGLTAGTLTISTAELAILIGGGVAMTALLLGRKIYFKSNGSVVIE